MTKEKKPNLESNLEAFRKMSEQINAQLKPITEFSERLNKQMELAFKPMKDMMDKFQGWNKIMFDKLKPTLEIIKKVQENHKEGKEIRGAIITDIIDLDEILEEIILKKYVKPELHEEVSINLFNDESFSSFLKMKVLARSSLIDEYDGLTKKIQTLLEIRNIIAHSKYRPTVQTVEILHKGKVKDLQSLKQNFDEIFKEVIEKLEKVSSNLK
jgi:hypothetical protein